MSLKSFKTSTTLFLASLSLLNNAIDSFEEALSMNTITMSNAPEPTPVTAEAIPKPSVTGHNTGIKMDAINIPLAATPNPAEDM